MDLHSYDIILVNSSAGKDSQATLDYIVEQARAQDVLACVVVVHADLGRVEWAGTKELAAEQAAHYGVRFEVVKRSQDLLDHIEQRRLWPSSNTRYCTSDHKRDQVAPLITRLVKELGLKDRKARVLNCLGIRAQESSARSKKAQFAADKRLTNSKRSVVTWYPIFHWTEAEVWARIKASGVRHHPAYDLGMKRLSCCFCVFAPKSALVIAGRHNPELLDAYVDVEARIGHQFTATLSIAAVREAVRSGAPITLKGAA